MATVGLERIRKDYAGSHTAVHDVTLEIADGELLVVVGPSGSGKSTILRLIAGLESLTAGRILIDARDVTHVLPQQRDVAMVFQSYALYPHKTVRENLMFGLRMRRIDARTMAHRVQRVAEAFGIERLLDRRPAQLSGGERQRVALGRAVVREPKAFLLDEPLSNLDPRLRASTRAELALLHRRLRATMVYVTHDQEEALTLGTRIAVMRAGTLEQVGSPVEIFERPANAFVAEFVGTPAMNLVPCASRRINGGIVAECSAFRIQIDPGQADASDQRAILIGIRPHDLEVVERPQGNEQEELTGKVEVTELLGSSSLLHVRPEGLGDQLLRVVVASESAPQPGAPIRLRIRQNRIHTFDAASGRRVS